MDAIKDGRLATVRPEDVQTYLVARGWTLEETLRERVATWVNDDRNVEVWLPLKPQVSDYQRLMVDLFKTLQDVENRSYEYILRDLKITWADILKIRATQTLMDFGSIRLSDGISLNQYTRDLMLAAARAALDPRPVYSSRPIQQASEYLRSARLGQTEASSYVITVISPIHALAPEKTRDEPFNRRVTRTLSDALRSARDAAIRALAESSIEAFDQVVESGVSANLCEALTGIGSVSSDNAVEINFAWSDQYRIENRIPRNIIFASNVVEVLKAAAVHLREKEPEEDFETRGTVHRLQDVPARTNVSVATINGTVDETSRSIKMQLSGENRSRAIQAFDDRLEINVRGTLDRRTSPYTLLEPITLSVSDF